MFNRKYIFKGSIFHCYVRLPECMKTISIFRSESAIHDVCFHLGIYKLQKRGREKHVCHVAFLTERILGIFARCFMNDNLSTVMKVVFLQMCI